MNELTIIEIRQIIQAVKDVYEHDFSNYAMTAFKSRLERLIIKYNIGTAGNLERKLRDEKEFFDTFLFEVSVPSTEMFRDPSLWRWLKEVYFPNVLSTGIGKFKIMVPCCVSGGELYSLAILLHEAGLWERVHITATCMSDTAIKLIQSGRYDLKKTEISRENYKRYAGARDDLSKYYTVERYHVIMDDSLLEGVEIKKSGNCFIEALQNVRLILFRNNLIYFNTGMQDKVLKHIHECLSAGGHLILGIQEKIGIPGSFQGFEAFNEIERVYRKKQIA